MSKCYKTSNNKFLNAPARMSYGFLTDFQRNFAVTDRYYNLGADEKPQKTSYEQRQWLIHNAEAIMNAEKEHEFLKHGHGDCKQPDPPGTMLPEKDKVVCDIHSCNVTHNYDNGVGQGRDFSNVNEGCLDYYYGKPLVLDNKQENKCKDNYV